jgi:hypothetical protein
MGGIGGDEPRLFPLDTALTVTESAAVAEKPLKYDKVKI